MIRGGSMGRWFTRRCLLSDLYMLDSLMNLVTPGVEIGKDPIGGHALPPPPKVLYYCPKCLHGFTLKSNRNRHYKYECGHEPRFKCPYCELRSKQTSQIYSHIRKKHPEERVFVVDLKV
nr:zinc finger X-chromosomal protein-like [Megalopta genalis]